VADDWFLQVPLSALVALQGLPGQLEEMKKDNAQLRKELEALRRMYFELLDKFSELKRESNGR